MLVTSWMISGEGKVPLSNCPSTLAVYVYAYLSPDWETRCLPYLLHWHTGHSHVWFVRDRTWYHWCSMSSSHQIRTSDHFLQTEQIDHHILGHIKKNTLSYETINRFLDQVNNLSTSFTLHQLETSTIYDAPLISYIPSQFCPQAQGNLCLTFTARYFKVDFTLWVGHWIWITLHHHKTGGKIKWHVKY